MLAISFFWALSNSLDEKIDASEHRSAVERNKRNKELADKNIIDHWLDKVIAYEAKTPDNSRTKYDFDRFISNSYDYRGLSVEPAWLSRSHVGLRKSFLDGLNYPEATREELQSGFEAEQKKTSKMKTQDLSLSLGGLSRKSSVDHQRGHRRKKAPARN